MKFLDPITGGVDATLGTITATTLTLTNALTQAKSHASPDTDSATSALHHTLGTGANQAAAGNDTRLSDTRTPSNDANLVHNTGTENISGVKTFQSAPVYFGSTSTTSVSISGGATSQSMEIGRTDGVGSTPFIDFHSGATAVDYDARIIASGGTGVAQGGTLTFSAGAVAVSNTLNTAGNLSEAGNRVYSAANAPPLAMASNDANLVHLTGIETITGAKTFSAVATTSGGLAATGTSGTYSTWNRAILNIPNGASIDWTSDGSWYRGFGATTGKFSWYKWNGSSYTELMALDSNSGNISVIGTAATGTLTVTGAATVSTTLGVTGATTLSALGGALTLNNATSGWINLGAGGYAAPSFTTRSVGTKLVLYDGLTGSVSDYALGVENGALWSSVGASSGNFKWYAGTTSIMTLTGAGALTTSGTLSEGSWRVHSGATDLFVGLRATAGTSIPTGAWTLVTMNTADYDTTGTGITTGGWKCNSAGYYRVGGCLQHGSSATGRRGSCIFINGTQQNGNQNFAPAVATGSSGNSMPTSSMIVYLALNDQVDIRGYQDSGGALTTAIGSGAQACLTIQRIREP